MTQAWQIRPFCVGGEAALRKVFHASVHGLAHPFYTPAQLQASDDPLVRQFLDGQPDGPIPFDAPPRAYGEAA